MHSKMMTVFVECVRHDLDQGPSRDKDSTINDSMTYTVIKMNNSMIKKSKTIKT
jgi:hypothetical protein